MKKVIKVMVITILSTLAVLLSIPLIIPGKIDQEITRIINAQIDGEIEFESSNISFFTQFPSLTINLNGVSLKGSAPFRQQELLMAKRLSFGLNIPSLWSSQIRIDEIYAEHAKVNVMVDEKGNANYNIYKPAGNTAVSDSTSAGTALKIEAIYLLNSEISYKDESIPFELKALNLNYQGKGDFSQDIFDLKSQLTADHIDLYYNHVPYLLHKKLNAKLVTKINTNSLELQFNENNLVINSLPISFVGKFAFLKDGYDLNFKTRAKETDLANIFSALPPAMAEEFSRTKITGYAEISASLTGQYIAATHQMPSATFNLKIRDGYIENPKVPVPVTSLSMNLQTRLPDLNMDRLFVDLDSLYFNMGKDHVAAVFKLDGLKEPILKTDTRTDIDLEKWSKAFNIEELDLKGRLVMDLKADGKFRKKVVRSGIRKVDTVWATVPRFALSSRLSNGYLKFKALPAAIEKINFDITGKNTDGLYQNTMLSVNDLTLKALSNYIKGNFQIQSRPDLPLQMSLKALLNLSDIAKVYPLKDLELHGTLNFDLNSAGPYNQAKKLFPKTTATLKMDNGSIKTAHFPEALTSIQIDAQMSNTDGTFRDSKVIIKPVSFVMAGQPFVLKAAVSDFENIRYDLSSKGNIDLGKMYQFFAIKGYQVKGNIFTNVHFKGLQSDAANGRYARLNNTGTIRIKQLNLQSDLFPEEFRISKGNFSFTSEQMKFEEFKAVYGSSDFSLNGYLENVMDYILSNKSNLKGIFTLQSKKINADEFMVYADQQPAKSSYGPNGVILIPENLNMQFKASAGQVFFNGLKLHEAKGIMELNNGVLRLKETGFNLIDAVVKMDATYRSTSLKSADFDFHLSAQDFDIAKAYREIKLFREMATSASSVKGIVGLDYQLSGRLNAAMFPVMPSIKGEGVLTLKKVSLMGFKMINAVSKETKRDSLNNPNLKDVQIKSHIDRNIMTIERTKMRIAGFRPRFEGQISLDGRLNISGRLGLPPFGLIGIPLSITGTQENPVIRLKRNKEGKLEETDDDN
ncbi:AsmA-like C-terminal region-containing protein [Pedobacter antarcticus]|uniref:AsmA family protein n=1 Tax=Pedobacter antarcticus TaxID=34086 RepID=UPI002930997B|nr:AsmA-like C-terminal region-containing protein [Pedobacter antarcticus]